MTTCTCRWLAVIAGAGLVVAGTIRPGDPPVAQAALQPAPPQALALGERLFNSGLVGHGLLLLAAAVIPLRQTTGQTLLTLPPARPQSGRNVWMLSGIMLAAIVLRLIGLNSGLWYDEVVTLTEFVRLPLPELVRNYADQNQHPLYSVLAHLSVAAFGESAWAVRLPAVLFGVAGLWAVYDFARRVAPPPEALLSAAFLTVSYHDVWFSQNARGYTALLFWAVLGSSLFVQNLAGPRWSLTLGYAAVMALALYTHLTAAFVIAAHGIIYLAVLSRKRLGGSLLPLAGFVLTATLAFQLYALVLPQVFASFQGQVGGQRVQAWTGLGWGAAQVVRGLNAGFAGFAAAALAIVAVGLVSFSRRAPVVVALLVLPCVIGLAVMVALNRHLYPRFFFPAFAFGVMIVVRGTVATGEWLVGLVDRAPARRLAGGLVMACLLIVASAASLAPGYRHPKQDYASALEYVNRNRKPEEPVVSVGMAALAVTRYYAPEVPSAATAAELAAIRGGRPTWLIYTFRDHMESFHPDLLRVIDDSFVCDRVFPGTVGGGAIIVCRSAPPIGP